MDTPGKKPSGKQPAGGKTTAGKPKSKAGRRPQDDTQADALFRSFMIKLAAQVQPHAQCSAHAARTHAACDALESPPRMRRKRCA